MNIGIYPGRKVETMKPSPVNRKAFLIFLIRSMLFLLLFLLANGAAISPVDADTAPIDSSGYFTNPNRSPSEFEFDRFSPASAAIPVECPPAPPGIGIHHFHPQVEAIWDRNPVVLILAKQGETRIYFAIEAIECWNMRLTGMELPIRLGPVFHSLELVPDAFLLQVSEAMLYGQPPPDLPESVDRMGGDTLIALSSPDFVSFCAKYPSKVLIGIKDGGLFPLALPNVARNVIAHELGHAIGLGHNDDPTRLMCGRPAPCRPDAFESAIPRFFPLTEEEEDMLREAYSPD